MSLRNTASLVLTLAIAHLAACERGSGEKAELPTTTPASAPKATAAPAAAKPASPSGEKVTPTEPPAIGDTIPPPPPGSTFFSGQTEAHRRSTLTPKLSSPVTRVHVRDGDIVKAGQVLVTLDTQDFSLRTQQAQAALQAAKVQLDAAKLDWDRTRLLLSDKAVPQSQFDMVDARYKGAQAGVAQAETAVAMGRKSLRDAVVHAPYNGIIVKRLVNEGEYATVMPATPLVIMEEVDPLDLRVQIPSTEMAKVKIGDAIRARFPATAQTLEARLTRVVAALDPRTRTFSVIAELPNKEHALRSGLYAEVSFLGAKAAEEPTKGKIATKPAAKPASAKPAAKPAPAKSTPAKPASAKPVLPAHKD